MEQHLNIIKVTDVIRNNREFIPVVCTEKESLLDLRTKYFPNMPVVTSVNGKVIEEGQLQHTYPKEGDYILFVPELQGGDNSVWRILAMIVVAVVAVILTVPTAGGSWAVFGSLFGGGIAGSVAATAIGGLIVGLGGMLVNALLPMPVPDIPEIESRSSQAYGWNPRTTQQQGLVVPVCYGINKLYGNVISAYTESLDGKNYQNLLIGLAKGPVKLIYDYQINDQAVTSLREITIHERRGEIDQTIIPNFNITKNEFPLLAANTPLTFASSPITKTTVGNGFDGLEVEVTFPNGLYRMSGEGQYEDNTVRLRCSIKEQSTTNWQVISLTPYSYTSVTDVGKWYKKYVIQGNWSNDNTTTEILVATTETTRGARSEGDYTHVYLNTSDMKYYAEAQPNVDSTLPAWYTWIGESVTQVVSAIADHDPVHGDRPNPITRTYKIENLNKGSYYDIKVERVSEDYTEETGHRVVSSCYLTNIREVVLDEYSYPRQAMAGVRALATDQLSGSFDFNCKTLGRYVLVYTGSQWNYEMSYNPAWITLDILLQPVVIDSAIGKLNISTSVGALNDIVRYDGIDISFFDLVKWKDWADFCDVIVDSDSITGTMSSVGVTVTGVGTSFLSQLHEGDFIKHATKGTRRVIQVYSDLSLEVDDNFSSNLASDTLTKVEKRCVFDGAFDSERDLWTAALSVAQTARAAIVLNGTKYTVTVDKSISGDSTQPVQLFSSGNVYMDTFNETFLPITDRVSEVEVDFVNRKKDFTRDRFTVFNSDIESTTNKITLQLFGITSPEQAWREGMYRLYQNQYIKRTIEFDVDVDAIACTVGDCIYFAHEVPQWGYSGRISSATSNTITLDREVTIASATTYEIMVRLSDDSLVIKTLTEMQATPGEHTVLTLDSGDTFSTVPTKFDVYTFGKLNLSKKVFRVIGLTRSQELRRTITAVEYSENVYNADTGAAIVPPIDYSSLSSISPVTGLALQEIAYIDSSGNVVRHINVSYTLPVESFLREVEIYKRTAPAGTWSLVGKTDQSTYLITTGILENTEYEILVVSVSNLNFKTTFANSPSETITTGVQADFFNSAFEQGITGLQIFDQGNDTEFEGKHCKFVWNDITAVDSVDVGAGEEISGAGTDILVNTWLKDYEVKILNTDGTLRRTEHVAVPVYTYIYEKNSEDGINGGATREFEIQVRARNRYFDLSNSAKLSVNNPAPPVPTNIQVSELYDGFAIKFDPVVDNDIAGYIVYSRQTTWGAGTPSESEAVYKGAAPHMFKVIDRAIGGTWYIKVAAYDLFGTDLLNYSTEYSAVVPVHTISNTEIEDFAISASKMFLNTVVLESDSWADNTPSAGYVQWNSHSLYHQGVEYAITGASTTNKYIYWTGGTTYQTSNANPTLTDSQFMIATNVSGTHDLAWNAIANQVIGSAYIQSAAIQTAHIENLAVTDAKIDTITANKLTAGTIDASVINVTNINADNINAGSIRGINITAASHMTKGSYLIQALSGSETTVYVKDTTDFPASGSAWIVDTTNDRDEIAYTGKTTTTLTGCSGVLAHNNGATIVPQTKTILIANNVNEMRFYGNRGDGTINELAAIGITDTFGDNSIINAGNSVTSRVCVNVQNNSASLPTINAYNYNGPGLHAVGVNEYGIWAGSSNDYGILANSTNSYGIFAASTFSYAGYFSGTIYATNKGSFISDIFQATEYVEIGEVVTPTNSVVATVGLGKIPVPKCRKSMRGDIISFPVVGQADHPELDGSDADHNNLTIDTNEYGFMVTNGLFYFIKCSEQVLYGDRLSPADNGFACKTNNSDTCVIGTCIADSELLEPNVWIVSVLVNVQAVKI